MGVSPLSWGPFLWGTIHLLCLGAPMTLETEQQAAYRGFFDSLTGVIPCGKCANHYRDHLFKTPVDATSRQSLFEWSVQLHNAVNATLGKPSMDIHGAFDTWLHIANNERGVRDMQHDSIHDYDVKNRNAWKSASLVMIFMIILMVCYYYLVLRKQLRK